MLLLLTHLQRQIPGMPPRKVQTKGRSWAQHHYRENPGIDRRGAQLNGYHGSTGRPRLRGKTPAVHTRNSHRPGADTSRQPARGITTAEGSCIGARNKREKKRALVSRADSGVCPHCPPQPPRCRDPNDAPNAPPLGQPGKDAAKLPCDTPPGAQS